MMGIRLYHHPHHFDRSEHSERSGEIQALAALVIMLSPLMRNAAAGMRQRYAIRRFIAIVGEEELTRLRVCRALRRYSPVAP